MPEGVRYKSPDVPLGPGAPENVLGREIWYPGPKNIFWSSLVDGRVYEKSIAACRCPFYNKSLWCGPHIKRRSKESLKGL